MEVIMTSTTNTPSTFRSLFATRAAVSRS